ncbi:hypothetical protein MXB_2421, partial [Myxobolus squamalis]
GKVVIKGFYSCEQQVVETVVDVEYLIDEFFIFKAKDLQKYLSLIYQSFLAVVHENFLTGRNCSSECSRYAGTTQQLRIPTIHRFSSPVKASLFSCVWQKVPKDRYLGVKQRLGSFTYRVLNVHRCNFLSRASTFPPMHDRQGIRSNLKRLLSMHLGPRFCKRRFSTLSLSHLRYYWSPKLVVADFDKSFLNAVSYQFTGTTIVICYFHFWQTLHRKMIIPRINQDAAI